MIDILMAKQCSVSQIRSFLAGVFDCSSDRIKTFNIDEFNSLSEEMDDSSIDCLCVFSFVSGDVSQLLQLYRYKIDDSEVIARTVDTALKSKVGCYVPDNSFNDWIYVSDTQVQRRAQQIASEEENCFLFKLY